MKLTDEQLGRLSILAMNVIKRATREYGIRPYRELFSAKDIFDLEHDLAHALEQVAAAKLMAEALETEKRIWAIQDGDLNGALWPNGAILERYQRLADVKCLQALTAWKALETTQDGESGGA